MSFMVSRLKHSAESLPPDDRKFHGWRLLCIVFCVVVVLATISFLVDWMVIGPLEGRVF